MKKMLLLLAVSFLLIGCGAATWGKMSQTEITSWQESGLTIETYSAWKENKFSPEDAQQWDSKGIKVEEAVSWRENKFTADEAVTWKNAGKSVEEAVEGRAEGLAPIN